MNSISIQIEELEDQADKLNHRIAELNLLKPQDPDFSEKLALKDHLEELLEDVELRLVDLIDQQESLDYGIIADDLDYIFEEDDF